MEQKWVVVVSFDTVARKVFGEFNSRGLVHEWLHKNDWHKSLLDGARDTWVKYTTQELARVFPLEIPS